MKAAVVLCLSALVLGGQAESVNPVSRVVKLLQGLSKQIEKEGKSEEELFETFVCWGKSVIAQKKESNTAAQSRIDSLETYISDLSSGKVELTSERQDLEKEIEELTGDIELAKSMRAQENADFLVAEDEMKKAVAALTSAVRVLGDANKKKASLVAFKTSVNEGFAARVAQGTSLNQAVELGEKFLSKGDAFFLRRLLTGEVPKHDWKKLNRKATFKMAYKNRSTKIQSVLKKLLSTFQRNLDDTTSKEKAAKASYDKLKGTKDGQLNKAQESLTKMEKENGAKGMSKADAQKEVSDLETQVTNDKKFIADTQSSMATKTTEWKERSKLRAGESAAISQAVSILSSDDAKDNFKKSHDSQGFLFLQTEQRSALITQAAKQIQKVASVANDKHLATLLGNMMKAGQFDAVVKAIDTMITNLRDNEAKDLSTKQDCEKTRMEDTRGAITAGQAIDDMTDAIAALTTEIKDLNKELEDTQAELKSATDEINEAKKLRAAENAEWKVSDGEDKEASETVASAMQVLEKFYKDNKMVLVQKQAPLPPPATWEGSYGGKTGESAGIIGILKLCQEDIDKDRVSAKADEDQAQAAYDKAFKAFEVQEKALKTTIGSLEGQIGARKTKVATTQKNRGTKKGELDATLKKISNADAGCNYIEVNYPLRVKNRKVEIDGLQKAKAILQGASFAKPADASREIKPGDAFLQRARRH